MGCVSSLHSPEFKLDRCLAACIRRADVLWGRDEKYWHVRERCIETALKNGVRVSVVIGLVQDCIHRDYCALKTTSAPLWHQVIHPEVLCEEVHES